MSPSECYAERRDDRRLITVSVRGWRVWRGHRVVAHGETTGTDGLADARAWCDENA